MGLIGETDFAALSNDLTDDVLAMACVLRERADMVRDDDVKELIDKLEILDIILRAGGPLPDRWQDARRART